MDRGTYRWAGGYRELSRMRSLFLLSQLVELAADEIDHREQIPHSTKAACFAFGSLDNPVGSINPLVSLVLNQWRIACSCLRNHR